MRGLPNRPGLVDVATEQLRTLLRCLHRNILDAPLTPAGLAMIGLQDVSHIILNHLRGLDRPAVHAVVVAVLAERSTGDDPSNPG